MSTDNAGASDSWPMQRPLMAVEFPEHIQSLRSEHDSPVDRWRRLAGEAYRHLLAQHHGRVVKHVGHGLVIEFADAHRCVKAAFALNRLATTLKGRSEASSPSQLRTAAHLPSGSSSNREASHRDLKLATELAASAEPGALLITAELRDRLTHGLDADFEDMGYWVESFAQPVRLFQAQPIPVGCLNDAISGSSDLRPCLAVIPFKPLASDTTHGMLGDLIAEGVIARLSHGMGLRVISRQSTSALRYSDEPNEIEHHLGATFVLTGSYRIRDRKLVVTAQLTEVCQSEPLWSGQIQHALADLLQTESELLHELARTVVQTLGMTQLHRAMTRPLPSLDSGFLMLAGVSMVHSHSSKVFERGREALGVLVERHPEVALPQAWLGMWHALNVVKGTSGQVARDIKRAYEQTQRALEIEPENAMALAVQGYIQCQLLSEPDRARRNLILAIEANPNEPMAWLFKSLHSAMWGSSSWAVTEVNFACALSPVDSLQYFFDVLKCNALLANHRLEDAIASGHRALKAQKHHIPALRLLLTAQAEQGRLAEGRATLRELRAEAPELTVSSYLSMGSADSPLRQRIANAMRQLGLPEN